MSDSDEYANVDIEAIKSENETIDGGGRTLFYVRSPIADWQIQVYAYTPLRAIKAALDYIGNEIPDDPIVDYDDEGGEE